MWRMWVQRTLLPILSAALLASGCTMGTPTVAPTGAPAGSVGAPSMPATASVTAATSPTAMPSTTPPTTPASAEPPDASLAAEGGDPVVGQLGSFTWGGGGSDSPWLPGTPLAVGSGERLTVSIAGALGVADWAARRITSGTSGGSGAVGLGAGTTPIAFAAPGPGSWSVQLTVRFAAALGTATYYWRLDVR